MALVVLGYFGKKSIYKKLMELDVTMNLKGPVLVIKNENKQRRFFIIKNLSTSYLEG